MNTTSLLGKGVYSVPEAARIVHASPRSVRRWISGYETQGTGRISPRILMTEVVKVEGAEVLTFQQLIEILFIKLFREHKVSMPTIRAAAKRASGMLGTAHPFAVEGLQTDGSAIFHLSAADVFQAAGDDEPITKKQIAQDLANGQMVLLEFALPYFRKIDYDKMEASRYWPLGKDRSVVIDPSRSFGQPIDANKKVPTKTLYKMCKSRSNPRGDDPETVSRWYGAPLNSVLDAIAFEESLSHRD